MIISRCDCGFTDICQQFGIDAKKVVPLGGYENRVFEVSCKEGVGILRLTSARRRTLNEVTAELEWISFLAAAGLPVATPLRSLADSVYQGELAHEGVVATLFTKAPGRPFSDRDWTSDVAFSWGHLLARMHILAREFHPQSYRRRQWFDDHRFCPHEFVPSDQPAFYDEWNRLRARLDRMPAGPSEYGLIHGDVNHENMHVVSGTGVRLFLFDFDDAMYSWFAHDLAISLFEARLFHARQGQRLSAEFEESLFAGYESKTPIDRSWKQSINLLVELQRLERIASKYRLRSTPSTTSVECV